MRRCLALAIIATPVLLANVSWAGEVPQVDVDVPITVPVVEATIPPVPVTVTVPELPVSLPTVSVPTVAVTVPAMTAPAAPVAVPAAAAPAVVSTPASPSGDLIPPKTTARAVTRRPPTLAAATRQAAAPFAVPLGAMALIAAYVVLRGALDRRDVRLASAHATDRWVGFE